MFDWSWIEDLDGVAAADELARTQQLVVAAEAGQFLLAAHWADVYAPDFVEDCISSLPGMPRLRAVADGCPEIHEYAGAELGALVGRSTRAGEQLVQDAVVVRHRHPRLWEAIKAGGVRVWVAAQVGRRCVRAGLGAAQAAWVDQETTPYVSTLPTSQFLELVDARIIQADPAAAEERARARALARFVHAGRVDEEGLRTLVARAHAGDVTYLVAVLDRMAHILAEQGDPRSLEVLRADALRILANPARALTLLTTATLEELDTAVETPGELGHERVFAHGDAGWMVDAHGRPLGGVSDQDELPLLNLDDTELGPAGEGASLVLGAAGPGDTGVEEHHDPALLERLLSALHDFDASRLDPVTVLYVHLSDAALATRAGVARVEEVGAATVGQVREWLTHPFTPEQIRQQVRVRPVLDADAVRPVTRYEFSPAMGELATCRTPHEVFPHGTLPSRRADKDHVVPYRHGADPPTGQTGMHNLAPLGRLHHRLKTNGGWAMLHPEPGVYLWRSPHSHWFRVDGAGTHHLGRDVALDEHLLSTGAAA